MAVDDELAEDEVVHVEVADNVQQVPEAMLVQVLCADVGRVDVGRDIVDEDPSLRHVVSDEKEAQRDVLRPRDEGAVSQRVQRRCVVAVQRHFREVLAEPYLGQHVRAEHCFLHCQSRRDQLRLHGRHGSQTL